jgi:DNA ligase-1
MKLEGSRNSQTNITSFFKSPSKTVSEDPNVDQKAQKQKKQDHALVSPVITKKAAPPKENNIVKIKAAIPADAVGCAIEKYHPVEHAPWSAGSATPYLHISRTFETIENTTKRLKISDMLVNAFRSILILSKDDIIKAAYLFLGRLAPDYKGIELNIGGSTVSSAITDALGISRNGIRELYKSLGDLGDVAAHCKRKQATLVEPAPLSVSCVYDSFYSIASESGAGSSNRKKQILTKLLRSSKESEIKYLVRTAIANLRIRAGWRSIIPALAKAIVIHKKQLQQDGSIDIESLPDKELLTQAANTSLDAFYLCPNLEQLIHTMSTFDTEAWSTHCSLTPGIPIKPMLAKISKGFEDAIEQMRDEKEALVEWKYDGMRAQIHANKNGLDPGVSSSNTVKIFSRNMEDRTSSFPDIIEPILQAMGDNVSSCILDGEIVAIKWSDCKTKYTIRAFQDLSTRPRVAGNESKNEVSICFFAFDILEMNGQNVASLPLRDRRSMLREALQDLIPGQVELARGSVHAIPCDTEKPPSDENTEQLNLNSIQDLLLESLDKGAEGLMIKSLDSSYEPNKRSNFWIKLKKDYCDGLHDTIDVVPIGAWHGNGRKAGWYSPFLLAIWDNNTEEYQSLCRCISGFSDKFYTDATERLSKAVIPKKPVHYRTNETPSIWFDTKEVWEIRGAEISLSPVHGAAMGQVHEERGLGLRFPRFIRIRDDKTPEEATDATQIVDMFTAQCRKTEAAL